MSASLKLKTENALERSRQQLEAYLKTKNLHVNQTFNGLNLLEEHVSSFNRPGYMLTFPNLPQPADSYLFKMTITLANEKAGPERIISSHNTNNIPGIRPGVKRKYNSRAERMALSDMIPKLDSSLLLLTKELEVRNIKPLPSRVLALMYLYVHFSTYGSGLPSATTRLHHKVYDFIAADVPLSMMEIAYDEDYIFEKPLFSPEQGLAYNGLPVSLIHELHNVPPYTINITSSQKWN